MYDARLSELTRAIRTVAVTGTNGKTTTTSMLAAVARAAGEPWARVTTLGMWAGGERVAEDGSMASFVRCVERAVESGARTLALETTSRSLAAGFARRWPPDVAVFTNLSRDHLDRHGTVEAYLAAKAQLFLALPAGGTAVLNADDPASALLAEVLPRGVVSRGWSVGESRPQHVATPVTLRASGVVASRRGTRVELAGSALAERLGGALHLRVAGRVHAHNALAAAVAADALGYDPDAIRAALESFEAVPGRFEVVAHEPLVVVDFAHTPDALAQTLRAARELVAPDGGRVVCVFGCGGDRDRGKRPEMGTIADAEADLVVLTNDNPRTESPEAIADMVAEGARGQAGWTRELDRRAAIRLAIQEANRVDAVVIAGRGHEAVQIVGTERRPFSDADVARQALAAIT